MSAQQGVDIGQYRSTYTVYEIDGTPFSGIQLLTDSEALAWAGEINETHPAEFYLVAHRSTATPDEVLGRWKQSISYPVDTKTQETLLDQMKPAAEK